MRIGTVLSLPNLYSEFGRIKDDTGIAYTVDAKNLPKGTEVGDNVAYKVELWENDSGLVYYLEED